MLIPDSVTSIRQRAFANCESLNGVVIPGEVVSIEDCAFWGCKNLRGLVIPASIKSIDGNPFYYCPALSKILIEGNAEDIERVKELLPEPLQSKVLTEEEYKSVKSIREEAIQYFLEQALSINKAYALMTTIPLRRKGLKTPKELFILINLFDDSHEALLLFKEKMLGIPYISEKQYRKDLGQLAIAEAGAIETTANRIATPYYQSLKLRLEKLNTIMPRKETTPAFFSPFSQDELKDRVEKEIQVIKRLLSLQEQGENVNLTDNEKKIASACRELSQIIKQYKPDVALYDRKALAESRGWMPEASRGG